MKISRHVFRKLTLLLCVMVALLAYNLPLALAADIEVPTVSAPTIAPPSMPKIPQPQVPQLPQIKAVKMEVDNIAKDIDNHARGNMKVEYKKDDSYQPQAATPQTNNQPPTSASNTKTVPTTPTERNENGLNVHSTTTVEKNNLPPRKDDSSEKPDSTYFKTHFLALLAHLFGKTAFIALTLWVILIFLIRSFPVWIDCLSFALIDSLVTSLYLALLHKTAAGNYVFAGQALSGDQLLALGSGFVFSCLLLAACISFFFYQRHKATEKSTFNFKK